MNGRWKSKGFYEFDIKERGKLRHIRSCDLEERIVQKCLCDYCLVPLLGKILIYDNGASTKNKGYSFAIKRVRKQLRQHVRKYGNSGWVLLFDFSKFFDNISHELSKQILREQITDERILRLCNAFIDAFGDIGLGLGSQISQVLALTVPNRLDHILKEYTQADKYERYMDDGCIIDINKDRQIQRLKLIKQICDESGVILNEKKTQIIPLSKGFKYLKCHFYIVNNNKILQKIDCSSPVRERQKLKKMSKLKKTGKVKKSDAYVSLQSWRSHANKCEAKKTVHEMENLYRKSFLSNQQNKLINKENIWQIQDKH